MNILISFIILIVAANLYILIRNEKVFVFRTYILDRAHNELLRILYEDIDKYESMHKEWNKIYDRHSYNKMLFSFKPLKSEHWFTEEEIKKFNLKPFDLEAAKAGKPVCTRDGRKVRIISFDRHGEDCPIIALVVDSKNAECEEVIDYTLDGICNENIINHNKYDLMMFPQKKEGWVNVYKSYNVGKKIPCMASIYPTKEEAKKSSVVGFDYVDTVKIEWEE